MKMLAAATFAAFAVATGPALAGPAMMTIDKTTTVNVGSLPGAVGPSQSNLNALEVPGPKRLGSSPLRASPAMGEDVPLAAGQGQATSSGKKAKSNPEVVFSFEGLNHRDSRLADNGNQFSGEPADQGLCVGNGYIVESVNSAIRVFDAATGAAVTPTLSLNEFYGFPSTFVRPAGPFGPFTFDISCHYDPDSNRWYHVALDLDQDPVTGNFTGLNFLDLAVSVSGDPTGAWNVYRIPGMNDGTFGTPNHGCSGPCFADFPHIGVDKNGVYISTNEFPFFVNGFIGAQVYAISKNALASGASNIQVVLFNTADPEYAIAPDQPGFTLWPALSSGMQFAGAQGGTNYFVSSNAVFTNDGVSDEMIVWALSNTKSLNTSSPAPRLTRKVLSSQAYAVPDSSVQRNGDIPFGNLNGFFTPGVIDTSDSRVLDARYANGKLWAVLGTNANVGGVDRAGVGWFVFRPKVNAAGVSATISGQGILALEDEALAYPTIAINNAGRGVIGFTRVGPDLFPSIGYASIDAVAGVGEVHMIKEGNAPQDGFTEYGGRARWGDYGAAATDGGDLYIANQYIEQGPCTVTELLTTDCNNTRTLFANWSTRVTKLTP